jgi:hypothetical protein
LRGVNNHPERRTRSPVALIQRANARRQFLDQARARLEYLPAFASLRCDELDLLFELAGAQRAALGLRRAARFLWREHHLRAVGGDGEAEALVTVALVLLRSDPIRGKVRLASDSHRRHRALSAWWWSALLSGLRATHDADVVEEQVDSLSNWIERGVQRADDPDVLKAARDVSVSSTRGLDSARYASRNAMSRILFSLLLRANPRDFVTGEPIDGLMLVESARVHGAKSEQVELHHVFPRSLLAAWRIEPTAQDQYANIALLSGATNGWISDRAPSDYVRELDRHFGGQVVDKLTRSHLLNAAALRDDGFERQISMRRLKLNSAVRRLLDPRAPSP